jgi:hypothetical protein
LTCVGAFHTLDKLSPFDDLSIRMCNRGVAFHASKGAAQRMYKYPEAEMPSTCRKKSIA